MTLSALIKKGGLTGFMTMTPATVATQEAGHSTTVAPVATVTVAGHPNHASELSQAEESGILEWLAYIEETDPEIIAEVIHQCRNDLDARRYFLNRQEEMPESINYNKS